MKKIVNLLAQKNILLKSLKEAKLSTIGSRKKIKLFSGVTPNGYFAVLFFVNQKSRFLIKNSHEIIELEKELALLEQHAYKHKYLLIASALCSKAKFFLEQKGWKILEDKNDTL